MKAIIRCAIVDDKPLAIDVLRTHAAKIPFLEISYTTTNPLDALAFIHDETVDLLFLDIQMPELTGLQVATLLGTKPRIIFTTAYTDYALDGFEHGAVDYLLKPISFERFYKAALKASELINLPVAPKPAISPVEPPKNYLFVKTEAKLVKVAFDDLLYVEAMQNYCVLHMVDKQVITLQLMKQMQEQLPANQFMRVHKSYLINIAKIDSIERSRIFIGKMVIPVGDSYRDSFYLRLNN